MLQQLMSLNVKVVGVITKNKSKFNSDFFDLKNVEIDGCKYFYATGINASDCVEFIKGLAPDYIFCMGWSNLIKQEILNFCPVIGYHPAALPQNKGRHPLIWALVLGLKETASTFFFMDEKADNGDIISQTKVYIEQNDDAMTLYQKIASVAKEQIKEICISLNTGSIKRISQKDQNGNIWRKRTIADGKIDFRMTSDGIYNLVRALARPYPGAHVEYKGNIIKVWKVRKTMCDYVNIESGKVLSSRDSTFVVKTCDGAIEILEHDFVNIPTKGEYIL